MNIILGLAGIVAAAFLASGTVTDVFAHMILAWVCAAASGALLGIGLARL